MLILEPPSRCLPVGLNHVGGRKPGFKTLKPIHIFHEVKYKRPFSVDSILTDLLIEIYKIPSKFQACKRCRMKFQVIVLLGILETSLILIHRMSSITRNAKTLNSKVQLNNQLPLLQVSIYVSMTANKCKWMWDAGKLRSLLFFISQDEYIVYKRIPKENFKYGKFKEDSPCPWDQVKSHRMLQ